MTTVEEIKIWMKRNGISRDQLGEKVLVKKKTVDGWLSSGKTIPEPKLELITRLMNGDEELFVPLPDDFEEYVRACAKELHQTIDDFVMDILKKAARFSANPVLDQGQKPSRPTKEISAPVEIPFHEIEVLGNIAAGALAEGDSVSFKVKTHRPLKKGEYVVRVNGASMEPTIRDGAIIVLRKYTTPPIPKPGTIVEYHDERGVTLKELSTRKTEDGKKEYILKSVNPNYPDIKPMDGGQISAVYVETLEDWKRA